MVEAERKMVGGRAGIGKRASLFLSFNILHKNEAWNCHKLLSEKERKRGKVNQINDIFELFSIVRLN